jgi:hypothetical protein
MPEGCKAQFADEVKCRTAVRPNLQRGEMPEGRKAEFAEEAKCRTAVRPSLRRRRNAASGNASLQSRELRATLSALFWRNSEAQTRVDEASPLVRSFGTASPPDVRRGFAPPQALFSKRAAPGVRALP